MRTLTRKQVEEGAKNRALLPRESDFKGKPGYWQRPAKVWRTGVGYVDGYKWGYKFKPNKNGKVTKQANEVGEMMQPFNRVELERQHYLQKQLPRAEMKDADGKPQYVDADIADKTAKRNRWHHRWRVWGRTVMYADASGQLWKRSGERWVKA